MERTETTPPPGTLDTDHVEVRTLTPKDLDWVVRIDKEHAGESRRGYYELKIKQAKSDTGVHISLGAFVSGDPAGFLVGRLYYGEFGLAGSTAILDSIGVAKSLAGQHVGKALMRQLQMNLSALRVEKIQTIVSWEQLDLVQFFQRSGFMPAPRFCLEMDVERPR